MGAKVNIKMRMKVKSKSYNRILHSNYSHIHIPSTFNYRNFPIYLKSLILIFDHQFKVEQPLTTLHSFPLDLMSTGPQAPKCIKRITGLGSVRSSGSHNVLLYIQHRQKGVFNTIPTNRTMPMQLFRALGVRLLVIFFLSLSYGPDRA